MEIFDIYTQHSKKQIKSRSSFRQNDGSNTSQVLFMIN